MEASASAPVLRNEDYHVPCHGVALTGHANRILAGPMSKDKGTYSSRINQIMRQAEKVPGPGKYQAHEPWDEGKQAHVIHAGNKFPAGSRDYKPMNKTPAPATYENKNFNLGVAISSNQNLSCNPRTLYGQIPKGKRRSSLDGAMKAGAAAPGPGSNEMTQHRNNKMDTAHIKVLSWAKEQGKSKSNKPKEIEIGPNHYTINYGSSEEKPSAQTIPKAKAQNFLDKAVKEKYVDLKTKREVPGPGTYNTQTYDDSKFTRGTRYLQLRGMSRSSVSGYF